MKSTDKYQSRIRILIGLFSILFGVLFILLFKLMFFTPRTLSEKDCQDCLSVIQSSQDSSAETTPSPSPTSTPTPTPEATVEPTVDTTTVSSIQKITNKNHPIDPGYIPADLTKVNVNSNGTQYLRSEAATALTNMFEAARKDNINLYLVSGYRSYEQQLELYNTYVATDGKALADQYDAIPGACEHQLGLAVDLSDDNRDHDIDDSFESTAAYQWLLKHSYEYGYILRFPRGKEAITGIAYNPWSFRYIGVEEAKKVYDSGLTLEEYYKVND
ncbi:D-alanyl-D-alanine carboxypeptidase family protein [uncultured Solobacterium sp.]|uniref:M15 family metallopeptidase n=1 Tax=uncultured Solobacterium sp. TaxID=747375 RepID=UPI0025EF9917|nr:M15 family metallopeptidase [uncultured Solobacterium sp.]